MSIYSVCVVTPLEDLGDEREEYISVLQRKRISKSMFQWQNSISLTPWHTDEKYDFDVYFIELTFRLLIGY